MIKVSGYGLVVTAHTLFIVRLPSTLHLLRFGDHLTGETLIFLLHIIWFVKDCENVLFCLFSCYFDMRYKI